MRLNFLKSPICLIAAVVIAGVCLLEIFHVVAIQRVEWLSYDWRVRLANRWGSGSANDATNLAFVEIGDNTIAEVNSGKLGPPYGLYWPRDVYGRGLEELTAQRAKAVAFDVLFAERRIDQDNSILVTLTNGDVTTPDDFFAFKLRGSGNAILAADQDVLPDPLFRTNAWRIGNISTQRDADGVLRRDQAFKDYRIWHPFIKQVVAHYELSLSQAVVEPGKITFYRKEKGGSFDLPTDANGMIDTTNIANPLPPKVPAKFQPFTPLRVWSMGIVLAAAQLKLDLDHPDIDMPHYRITLRGENGVTRVIPVDSEGYFYVDWVIGLHSPKLTKGAFEDLLSSGINRTNGQPGEDEFRSKLVVIGSTATGNDLADMGSTALESLTHLASKHWNVANSVISGRFIRTTSESVNLLLIVFVGALSAWITWVVVRPVTGSILMTLAAVAYITVAVGLFIQWRIWVPIVLPLVCAGLITHLTALTYRVTVEQSERKRVRSLFTRLVSPEVVNELLGAKEISLDSLSGERREITVSFADIRGFTELTDSTQSAGTEFVRRHAFSAEKAEEYFDEQAREVMKTVSLYLSTIADCVKKHQGTLDKYIGDCVMAFWGAPLPNPRHALDAVRCAIEAQQSLFALNQQRREENQRREKENAERLQNNQPLLPLLPILSMGTGINTGLAIVGLMGSEVHKVDYTVFGREVNLASRLEGISGHGRIVVGEGTYLALQRDAPDLAKQCIELPRQPVKGFREHVRMFEVPWKSSALAAQSLAQSGQTRDNPAAVA